MENGVIFRGTYLATAGKMFGLKHLIVLQHLDRKETMLFNYLGDVGFDIINFDKTKVEKVFANIVCATGNFNSM